LFSMKEDIVIKELEGKRDKPTTDDVREACEKHDLTFTDVEGFWLVFHRVLNRWTQLRRRY